MLKEQDIGAESCHTDLGGGKALMHLKILTFTLICGQEQTLYGTDTQMRSIPEMFASYKVVNNSQLLDLLFFLFSSLLLLLLSPPKKRKKIDSAPITDRHVEWHNSICLTSSL